MKLTIIPVDKTVYKDDVSFGNLDLVGIPEDVHALQWNNNSGWIEFFNTEEFRRTPNENITELPSWANDALQKWEEANAAAIAAAAAAKSIKPVAPEEIPVTVTP